MAASERRPTRYWALVSEGDTPGTGEAESSPEGATLPQGYTSAHDSLGAFLASEAIAETVRTLPGAAWEALEFEGTPLEKDLWRESGVVVVRPVTIERRVTLAALLEEVAAANPLLREQAVTLRSVLRGVDAARASHA